VETKISVLLANDFPLVRDSVTNLLNSCCDMQVVACAKSKDEVLSLADSQRPAISIIDLEVEWPVLTDLVRPLAKGSGTVLVLSDVADDEKVFELLMAGATGIVSPRANSDLFCRSIRAVARGEIWVSRSATTHLIDQLRMQVSEITIPKCLQEQVSPAAGQSSPKTPIRGLTKRELQIVSAIGDAMSNKDIAVQLGISEYTVKHHLTSIFNKVGVYSRLELAMMATHHGLIAKEPAVA